MWARGSRARMVVYWTTVCAPAGHRETHGLTLIRRCLISLNCQRRAERVETEQGLARLLQRSSVLRHPDASLRQRKRAPFAERPLISLQSRCKPESKNGRDDWIRTSDPLTPSQVRYQAAPHPDIVIVQRLPRPHHSPNSSHAPPHTIRTLTNSSAPIAGTWSRTCSGYDGRHTPTGTGRLRWTLWTTYSSDFVPR